jgi:hypothetical protein
MTNFEIVKRDAQQLPAHAKSCSLYDPTAA